MINVLCGHLQTLRDLGDGGTAAAGRALDRVPGLPGGDHAGDPGIAFGVLGTALVFALGLGLGLGLALRVAAALRPFGIGRL